MDNPAAAASPDYCELIAKYLKEGLKLKEAVQVIGNRHGIWRRTAQRHAQSLGLGEDSVVMSADILISLIQEKLKGVGRGMGCDALWRLIQRKYAIKTRQIIRYIVETVQPGRNAVMKRQRLQRRVYSVKGPNHMWHADGNDKLKPYGLCISACIDGFSRRLIWVEVSSSNKNPTLICSYFLRSVSLLPRVIRLDHGTENVHMATCQKLLRASHGDSLVGVSVMLGSSNHNQRIERFWSYLRSVLLQDYMNVFKDYLSTGLIDFSNAVHIECVAFCFLPLLRSELREIFNIWNYSHEVRCMKSAGCPSGIIPGVLFAHPEIRGAEQQSLPVDNEVFQNCTKSYTNHVVVDIDPSFEEWAEQFMNDSHLSSPTSIDTACELFNELICKLDESSVA